MHPENPITIPPMIAPMPAPVSLFFLDAQHSAAIVALRQRLVLPPLHALAQFVSTQLPPPPPGPSVARRSPSAVLLQPGLRLLVARHRPFAEPGQHSSSRLQFHHDRVDNVRLQP